MRQIFLIQGDQILPCGRGKEKRKANHSRSGLRSGLRRKDCTLVSSARLLKKRRGITQVAVGGPKTREDPDLTLRATAWRDTKEVPTRAVPSCEEKRQPDGLRWRELRMLCETLGSLGSQKNNSMVSHSQRRESGLKGSYESGSSHAVSRPHVGRETVRSDTGQKE